MPLQQDILSRIVRLAFTSKPRTLVLDIEIAHQNNPDPLSVNFTVNGQQFSAFDNGPIKVLVQGAPKPDTEVVDPVSKDMVRNLKIWSANDSPFNGISPPFGDDPGHATGRMLIFINLAAMAAQIHKAEPKRDTFDISVGFPGSGPNKPGDPGTTAYYVWFDFGDPFPGVPPYLYSANISYDSVWDNEADAAARCAILNVHSAYHIETETGETGPDKPDLIDWWTWAQIYVDYKDFPTQLAEPMWGYGNPLGLSGDYPPAVDEMVSEAAEHGHRGAGGDALPATSVRYTVDMKKFKVTSVKS